MNGEGEGLTAALMFFGFELPSEITDLLLPGRLAIILPFDQVKGALRSFAGNLAHLLC